MKLLRWYSETMWTRMTSLTVSNYELSALARTYVLAIIYEPFGIVSWNFTYVFKLALLISTPPTSPLLLTLKWPFGLDFFFMCNYCISVLHILYSLGYLDCNFWPLGGLCNVFYTAFLIHGFTAVKKKAHRVKMNYWAELSVESLSDKTVLTVLW